MVKKIFIQFGLCILFCLGSQVASAQSASKILDTAAAKFKNASGVKINYSYASGGTTGNGTIKMSGSKFVNDMGDIVVWFNGKTMWTLVKSNEEVTVTNPSSKELAKLNPYAFVSLYKKGYKASIGKSTNTYHEVLLKATKSQSAIQSMTVRLNKMTYQPVSLKMTGNNLNADITVKSYSTGQTFSDATFTFSSKNYPDVDIIDLR